MKDETEKSGIADLNYFYFSIFPCVNEHNEHVSILLISRDETF